MRLKGAVKVGHSTLANYESGKTQPPVDVLAALAQLYDRSLNWFLSDSATLEGIQYRNRKSRVKLGDLARYEAAAQKWIDAYRAIECVLNKPMKKSIDTTGLVLADPAAAAERFRRDVLELDDGDPVPSVVEVLEALKIRVIELSSDLAIDGFAAWAGTEHVVVLNSEVDPARGRLNAAHEMWHILHGDCRAGASGPDRENETAAFLWATHLLMPTVTLARAIKERSIVELVSYKQRFGISLPAMIYRAEKDGLIKPRLARRIFIEMNRRGWRHFEPGVVAPDRANRFERLVDGAIVRGRLSWEDAARHAGVRVEELKARVNRATGAADEALAVRSTPTEPHAPRMRYVG